MGGTKLLIEPCGQGILFGQSLEEAIQAALRLIREVKETYLPTVTFALFSGGNDSTTLLHLVQRHIDCVLHINTGIGIQETRDWARGTADAWKCPWLEKFTPPDEYRDLVLRYGMPGPHHHGLMYSHLKERRLCEVRNAHAGRKRPVLFLTGLRSFESKRRAKYHARPFRRDGHIVWCNPIIHFDARLMWEYASAFNLPRNPVSDLIHKSGECLCGAFAAKGEMKELELWFPQEAAYIHQLEDEVRTAGKKRCIWGQGDIKGKLPEPPGPLCAACRLFADHTQEVDG